MAVFFLNILDRKIDAHALGYAWSCYTVFLRVTISLRQNQYLPNNFNITLHKNTRKIDCWDEWLHLRKWQNFENYQFYSYKLIHSTSCYFSFDIILSYQNNYNQKYFITLQFEDKSERHKDSIYTSFIIKFVPFPYMLRDTFVFDFRIFTIYYTVWTYDEVTCFLIKNLSHWMI